jgi:hypothetical protein
MRGGDVRKAIIGAALVGALAIGGTGVAAAEVPSSGERALTPPSELVVSLTLDENTLVFDLMHPTFRTCDDDVAVRDTSRLAAGACVPELPDASAVTITGLANGVTYEVR